MTKYLIKRFLLMFPTLIGVAALIFFLMRVVPGDIVELRFSGESSNVSKEQITEEIKLRFALSLQLSIMATIVAVLLAIPLGVLAALKQDTWVDYAVRIFSIAGLATPSFWLGIMFILGLLIVFHWLPPMVYTPFWVSPWQNLLQLIRTARAKGLWQNLILSRHALKNAMLPVLTVVALEFAFLLGGLVVTEQVFNLNGLGMLFVESVARRDYTLTQALVMLVAFVFIFVNFAVDLMYAWLDPRIRFR